MLNDCLEWYKKVLNEVMHSGQLFYRHLFYGRRRSVVYRTLSIVWLRLHNREFNNWLYHCRHSARDKQSGDRAYIFGMTEMWLLRVKLVIASYDGDRMWRNDDVIDIEALSRDAPHRSRDLSTSALASAPGQHSSCKQQQQVSNIVVTKSKLRTKN